jgi:hypothetical protein
VREVAFPHHAIPVASRTANRVARRHEAACGWEPCRAVRSSQGQSMVPLVTPVVAQEKRTE